MLRSASYGTTHPHRRYLAWLLVLLVLGACTRFESEDETAAAASHYEERPSQNPDGSGRFYMGREISRVMGHRGADWLERPTREAQELPGRVVRALDLQPGDVVADIGAGTGYFTFRLAAAVPQGRVLAVDIQPEMLQIIRERKETLQAENVVPVLGTPQDPRLPAEAVDVALIVDAYHEFSHPYEMVSEIMKALKPGGRLVLVEYRGEDPTVPIKPLHKMTEEQAIKEMRAVGLVWRETKDFLPQQHILIFEKPAE